MSKKSLDNMVKNVEVFSNKVNVIMRNRLIIALFLMVDGVTFMLNPHGSLSEMARSIIILVLVASFSTLLAGLATREKDIKSIIFSTLFLVLGIILYIYPDLVSAYIQIILSGFIIFNGLSNIVSTLNSNRLLRYTKSITEKYNGIVNSKKTNKDLNEEKFKNISNNFNEGMEQQKEKLLSPLKNILNKSTKSSSLFIATNIASIILGIILLIYPDTSMVIWGIIFLYTGLSDFLVSIKSMNLLKRVKKN